MKNSEASSKKYMLGPEYIQSDFVHPKQNMWRLIMKWKKLPRSMHQEVRRICLQMMRPRYIHRKFAALYDDREACVDRSKGKPENVNAREVGASFSTDQAPTSLNSMPANSSPLPYPSEAATSTITGSTPEFTPVGSFDETSAVTIPRANTPTTSLASVDTEQVVTRPVSPRAIPTAGLPGSTTVGGVDLSTFYSVEAILVPDATSVRINDQPELPSSPVYDAILVSEQVPKPWWKRRQGFYLTGIFLFVVVLVIILAVVITGNDGPEGKTGAKKKVKLHPNHSETCATFKRGLLQADCDDCQPNVAVDGNMVVVAKDHDHVQFLLNTNGNLEIVSKFGIDYAVWGTPVISDNIILIGGGNETTGNGAVHVFEKSSSGVWNEATVLIPKDIDESAWFGRSISFDKGRIIAVGAVADRGVGSVFIYKSSKAGWEMDTKIAPDIPHVRNFGRTVSLKGDVIFVGDRIYGEPRKGAVFVYAYDEPSSSWKRRTNITNDDCDQWFGTSLSILDNGLVIGCPRDDGGIGAAYYYQGKHNEGQYKMVQKILSSNGTYYDNFAHNNQLATDGENILAIGTNRKWNGAVYLYTLIDDEWLEFAKISEPETTEHFGDVVGLSGNNMVIASAKNAYFYSVKECLGLIISDK